MNRNQGPDYAKNYTWDSDLYHILIQVHLKIRFKLGIITKLEVWWLLEICQALQIKKLSQDVDFDIGIAILKGHKEKSVDWCLKIGLDKSLQSGDIWFHNIASVLASVLWKFPT